MGLRQVIEVSVWSHIRVKNRPLMIFGLVSEIVEYAFQLIKPFFVHLDQVLLLTQFTMIF